MSFWWFRSGLVVTLAVVVACTSSTTDSGTSTSGGRLPASFILGEKPGGAKSLLETKVRSAVGQKVAFEARIGGRADPFVANRAIMIVADSVLESCDQIPGDTCPHPWDYCCEDPENLLEHTASVQFVDAAGKPLEVSIKDQHGLSPGRTIYVVGEVSEKAEGVFVVNATGVYVAAS